jgi:hypothetical protein
VINLDYNKDVYLEQFNNNYYGRTKEAEELKDYLKDGFQGGTYIPWAVMQRLLKQQDPDFFFTIHENYDGGTVFWQHGTNHTTLPFYGKGHEGNEFVDEEITAIEWHNYFVKVSCTFFGRTETEYYPIQGQVGKVFNGAPKIIDQNMVNKAIQRAKAKVAAAVSGLAFSLYENGDLQFEPEDETTGKKTLVKKETKQKEVVEQPTEETVKQPTEGKVEEVIEETISAMSYNIAEYLIKNKEKANPILQKLNVTVAKTYGFVFDLDETASQIASNLDRVSNTTVFFKAILTQMGMKPDEITKVMVDLEGGANGA